MIWKLLIKQILKSTFLNIIWNINTFLKQYKDIFVGERKVLDHE